MALLFMDSFDHYALADLTEKYTTSATASSGTLEVSAAGGRRASGALRCRNNSSHSATCYTQKVLAPADATAIVGVAIYVEASTVGATGLALLYVRDGATAQVTLRLNSDLTLSVVRGAQNGTVLGTTSATVSAAVFVSLELKVLIHNTAGTVDLRINGASVLSLTSQNTRNTATAQWTSLMLGPGDFLASIWAAANRSFYLDDLYVLDGSGAAPWNDFLGDCRVDVRFPTGAGATTAWTPSTGANWQCVDDAAPNDDTDYTAAPSAGVVDTFVVQDAPVAGAAIYGVQHCLTAKKSDAGTASIAPVVRHSGVDYVGTDINPSTAYTGYLQIAALNPGTAAAWTEAGFNAAEFGYKRTV